MTSESSPGSFRSPSEAAQGKSRFPLRLATAADVPALVALIEHSTRVLQAPYYSPAQLEAALGPVFGVDRQLICDRTYFVVEDGDSIVGCGGGAADWR